LGSAEIEGDEGQFMVEKSPVLGNSRDHASGRNWLTEHTRRF